VMLAVVAGRGVRRVVAGIGAGHRDAAHAHGLASTDVLIGKSRARVAVVNTSPDTRLSESVTVSRRRPVAKLCSRPWRLRSAPWHDVGGSVVVVLKV